MRESREGRRKRKRTRAVVLVGAGARSANRGAPTSVGPCLHCARRTPFVGRYTGGRFCCLPCWRTFWRRRGEDPNVLPRPNGEEHRL